MPDESPLIFMMGEYRAEIPTDRMYISNHMWAMPHADSRLRFGLTSYAVRLLQDVYFLDWTADRTAIVTHRQCIGSIESKKAESDLYAPCAGLITDINSVALDDPSVINVDSYGEGWLLEMDPRDPDLLTPDAYVEHLHTAWKVAERTIKGQIQ